MQDILAKILRQDFKSFLIKSFYTLHGSHAFLDNWHLNLLSEYLSAVEKGEIKRLIINIAPRSLKSICISVAWPAWLLARDPTRKIISASYSQLLSTKHGLDCRKIIQSDWYQQFFPESCIMRGENSKNKFATLANGFRLSTSIGGTLTGEGGNFLIVDDPLTPMQALRSSFRDRANSWFEQTFYSRLDEPRKGVIVIVMQRLHTQDLTGFILNKKQEDWVLLNLPLIAERDEIFELNTFKYRRKIGEALHPVRCDLTVASKIKESLSTYAFAAQYQQNPVPLDSGIIKEQWLQYYADLPEFQFIYQSWDCAIKTGQNNDFSACTTWGLYENNYYLIDVLKAKMDYPTLKRKVIEQAAQYKVSAVLIEDKASGQQLVQDLKNSGFNVVKCQPEFDKLTRLAISSNIFESGRVFIRAKQRWSEDFVMEITTFPGNAHDDQVDSATQFLNWAEKKRQQSGLRVRVL